MARQGQKADNMALNLVCAVLDRGPADLAEMAVLLAIADGADKDTGEAWPSCATIARRARQSERSVQKVLARLIEAGWLRKEPRMRANGSQQSNLYIVNLEMLGEAPRGSRAPRSEPRGGERGSPPRVNVVQGGGERGSPPGGERSSPLEPSHQLNLTAAPDFSSLNGFQRKQIREGNSVLLGGPDPVAGDALRALQRAYLAWERSQAA